MGYDNIYKYYFQKEFSKFFYNDSNAYLQTNTSEIQIEVNSCIKIEKNIGSWFHRLINSL